MKRFAPGLLIPVPVFVPPAHGQPAPAEAVPPDPVVTMRQHWLDADINAFTFRNSAQMFETRPVLRAGPVWELPRGEVLSPPDYVFNGQRRTYADFAAR